jgi:hypothetical protein
MGGKTNQTCDSTSFDGFPPMAVLFLLDLKAGSHFCVTPDKELYIFQNLPFHD